MVKGVEATVMLDLVETIYHKTKHLNNRSITISNDNCLLMKSVSEELLKENQYTLNAGSEITKIKQLVKEYLIEIYFR